MDQHAADEREADVLATMIRLADTVVSGYDVIEILHDLSRSCLRILDADAAGISLAPAGALQFMTASEESMELIELFQIDHREGPSEDAYQTGRPAHTGDIHADRARWPQWAARASELGFRAANAFPMRLRSDCIGALSVYSRRPRTLTDRDVAVGQALADMATIGILHARTVTDSAMLSEQLQGALDSRVLVEQAKGWLANRHGISVAEAFERLRKHARDHQLTLRAVADDVVNSDLDLPEPHAPHDPRRRPHPGRA